MVDEESMDHSDGNGRRYSKLPTTNMRINEQRPTSSLSPGI
jgi:hypothetical protein